MIIHSMFWLKDASQLRLRSAATSSASASTEFSMNANLFDQSNEKEKAMHAAAKSKSQFRKIVLLIIAVTVHNIPGFVLDMRFNSY